ncbi:uncharacterized protein LOC117642646 [Thrips palmi]|uniref:Uncharacterized protein LOC117642646 n=1 Tax=Thrips palmi TaxID=161013 RepID=A0A6P8YBG2_THRPL|nr:uncharacterized protein LOC117642646 [Thrips palmi]
MVSRTLLAALAVAAFLATIPASSADCMSSCQSAQTPCTVNCGTDEDCAVKCARTAIKCICDCKPAMTRTAPTSTSAAEARDAILRLSGTKSAITDLTKCMNDATADSPSCLFHCGTDVSCIQNCTNKMLDRMCTCGAASLQAGILVTLVALLSWFAQH